MSSAFTATDPRDHVYALLGLSPPTHGSQLMEPDYRKTAAEVYRDATMFVLQSEEDHILAHIDHRRNAEMTTTDVGPDDHYRFGNPEEDSLTASQTSWTIPWNRKARPQISLSCARAAADSGLEPTTLTIQHHEDPNVLRVKGYLLGHVVKRSQPIDWQLAFFDTLVKMAEEFYEFSQKCSESHAGDIEDATSISVRTQRFQNRIKKAAGPAHRLAAPGSSAIRHILASVFVCGHFEGENKLDDLMVADDETFESEVHLQITSLSDCRQLMVTSDGYLGSGPNLTREGDRLFIMEGGRHVHVVRPWENHYLYVGAAWVDGLMKGEMLKKGINTEWIDLR